MIKRTLQTYVQDFSHLLFPIQCQGCAQTLDVDEKLICAECLDDLPKTRYWELKENTVERLFWGKLPLEGACTFLFFTKGSIVQELLHKLKYKSKTEVGVRLGELFGEHLQSSRFQDVDM